MISGIFCIEMAFPLCASICAISAVGLFWNFFHIFHKTPWDAVVDGYEVQSGRSLPSLPATQRLLWWPCPLLWALGRENHQAQFNPGSCTPDGCRSCAKSSEGGSLHFAWEWQEAGWYLSPKLGWGKRCCSWCNGHQPTAAGDRGGGSYNTRSQPWLRFWQKNEGSCRRLPEAGGRFHPSGIWVSWWMAQDSRGAGEKNCTSLGETDRPRGKWMCQQGHLKAVFTPNEGKCCNFDQPDPFCSWPSHWWGPVMTPISPVLFSRLFDIDYHHLYDNNCQ